MSSRVEAGSDRSTRANGASMGSEPPSDRNLTDLGHAISSADDGLLCIGPDGGVRFANPASISLLGIPADPTGHDYRVLRHPSLIDRIERCLESSDSCAPAWATILAGDRTLLLRAWRAGVDDSILAISIHDDSLLIEGRERVEAVLDATTDGLVVLSSAFVVTFANPAAQTILGRSAEELVGSRLDTPQLGWVNDPELAESGGREIEFKHDDRTRVVMATASPIIDSDGDVIGRVISLRDITAEAEAARMKNEFVSTVSHELRTPLTSIKGYVDLILDGDAGEISDIQREFLSIVKENSDRLVDLINEMLDLSRIESGRIHLKVEPLDVEDVTAGALDTFRAVLAQSDRSIEVDIEPGLPLIAADRDRVRQVLINLVSNALKYSPAGGPVLIRVAIEHEQIRFSVTDHGLGIDEQDQKLLFTKFYRVDSAMTREIGGTGLGLSICKSIIELLGGKIGADSEIGKGSTFWFTLPVAAEELIRLPEISIPDGAKGTVLVIDNDPEIASLIETYLMRRGFDVYKAYDAESAIATARRVSPQVITLDVIMKGGDGFDLIRRFKELPETSQTPVVVLSIVCDEGRSCRFGAANYLEKPIDQKRLFDIVGGLVGSVDSPLVLVVDDDKSLAGVVSETLKNKGYSTAVAYNGIEALAAIESHHPHAIILDLKMPKMDGYEVIHRVKTNPAWVDIPIVVMTAHPVEGTNTELLTQVAAQISKPLSPDDIAAQVEQLLSPSGVGDPR